LTIISLSTAEHRSSFSQSNFTMTQFSVKNQSENYDSLNFQVKSLKDFVIYSQLSKYIFAYFRKDVVWKKRQFMLDFTVFNDSDDAIMLWNIKNIKQLKWWVKKDSKWFLKVLNDIRKQWDLNVKTLDLFNKIFND
jgi:hypothetical protein